MLRWIRTAILGASLILLGQVSAEPVTGARARFVVEARMTEYRGVSKHSGFYTGGFQPNYIEVAKGQTVTLVLTSKDGTHSLAIPELGQQTGPVGPGESAELTFAAEQEGDFEIRCQTRCGPNHKQMVGRLVVLPLESPTTDKE